MLLDYSRVAACRSRNKWGFSSASLSPIRRGTERVSIVCNGEITRARGRTEKKQVVHVEERILPRRNVLHSEDRSLRAVSRFQELAHLALFLPRRPS